MKKVHITSLGCAKNLVDSEVLGGQLRKRKYNLTESPADADLIIVNTCGFIEDAKNESIQAIFEALDLKYADPNKQVFVTGCLSQRYKNDLAKEIPEIDAIFGTEDYKQILNTLGEDNYHPEDNYKIRELSTPRHFAYLKISEGCNHTCSFCAIPAIRGKHRSRKIDDILLEAKILADQGVKELILISQDTSYFGKDMGNRQLILDLLEKLAQEKLFLWIRPLYWYPTNFPFGFLDLMNKYESIVPYLDMPIQHASTKMLKLMRRAESREGLADLYQKVKKVRPDISLRTTLIVGHPGETKEDFIILSDFIEQIQFDRLGAFIYSDEDGTASFDLDDKVDKSIAQYRYSILLEQQRKISTAKNKKKINTVQTVLIDGYDQNQKFYHGRTYRDAPEIDNEVIVTSPEFQKDVIGSLKKVMISGSSEYELYGSFDVN